MLTLAGRTESAGKSSKLPIMSVNYPPPADWQQVVQPPTVQPPVDWPQPVQPQYSHWGSHIPNNNVWIVIVRVAGIAVAVIGYLTGAFSLVFFLTAFDSLGPLGLPDLQGSFTVTGIFVAIESWVAATLVLAATMLVTNMAKHVQETRQIMGQFIPLP